MHLYVWLKSISESDKIPINYNYLIQSAIYSNLTPDLASKLHDKGYNVGKRSFKLFAFSKLLGRYVINKNKGTISFPEGVKLVISSPDTAFIDSFVNTVLKRDYLRIGEVKFELLGIKTKGNTILHEAVKLKSLSPVVVYRTLIKPEGGKYTCYYQPGEPEFERLIDNNLRKKYSAFYGKNPPEGNIQVRLMNRPRLHVMRYKGTVVKGYTCSLQLKGPRELLQIALDAGLGSKGSQGFGCIELLEGGNARA